MCCQLSFCRCMKKNLISWSWTAPLHKAGRKENVTLKPDLFPCLGRFPTRVYPYDPSLPSTFFFKRERADRDARVRRAADGADHNRAAGSRG